MVLFSCNSGKKEVFIAPENALNLIAGDSVKTWKLAKRINDGHRMNMGDCFLSYRVSYAQDFTMGDNNGSHADCGDSLEAKWETFTSQDGSFIKLSGGNLAELLNLDQDYKYFRINALNKDSLVLQFKHQQFSTKTTIIIDYLVPEDMVVSDRDFHNK